jgi:hypothetical protein
VTTYAFALYHQGKATEALNVMAELDSRAYQIPVVAHYYAVFLQAAGRAGDAAPFLGLATEAILLEEEVSLFNR